VDRIGAMATLPGIGLIDLHLLAVSGVADLLDGKLDPANFEDVALLDFVVLI
jgi:hypothetical protein